MNNVLETNKVFISGEIVSETEFSHEVYGESFYETSVLVKRLSGQNDILPITISERLITDKKLKKGSVINAFGQFRSYNKLVDGKSKLMLTVFVREVLDELDVKNPNAIMLVGYLCKQPVYRTTPFNREIADLLIAVNRSYNKSDYIPCIAWGRNARFAKRLNVGEKISIVGRVQSREYQKKMDENKFETFTAYEVSISKLAASDSAENLFSEEFDFLRTKNKEITDRYSIHDDVTDYAVLTEDKDFS